METDKTSHDLVETDTENSNQLLTTDTEILLSILPSNVWAYTFQKLEEKHSSSLENLSNSSPYLRNVILSKRVLFLFPQVIKLIGPEFANQKNTKAEGSSIIKSRIICKQWNDAVDKFIIDGTLEPDFFNTQPPQPSDHALINARYQYFGHMSPTKLPQFLSHFEQTHSPHSPRNPFIGKVVHIDLTGFEDLTPRAPIADHALTLLRKYGHHIMILNLGSSMVHDYENERLENHSWLLECLGYCPNLTHLKVFEDFNVDGEMDVAFGERPDPRRRTPRCCRGSPMEQRLVAMDNFFRTVYLDYCAQFGGFENRMGCECGQYGLMDGWMDLLAPHYHHDIAPLPGPVVPQNRPIDANPINPIATLENLKCLKLCGLSFLNFNVLISANTHVVWLQIEPANVERERYIDFHSLEFPNLKKLSIKLGFPEDVRNLRNVHESWLQVTHLQFEYCTSGLCFASSQFMEWIEIFGVISEKWGNTLTDLRLRLPMATSEVDRDKIVRDSGQFRLYLPKLKRLKIWLNERPGEMRVAKMDFLDLVKVGLEQLIIE